MNTQHTHSHGKKHAPFAVIIILFGIIFLLAFLLKQNPPNGNPPPTHGTVAQKSYHCGITISNPTPTQAVTFPLTVNAIVNNSAATDGCTWSLFEGQAGTVELKDQNGATLAKMPMQTPPQTDWMTNGPVPFSAILTPSQAIPSGTPLSLTFSEEDASGMGNSDTFSFTIVAQ